MIPRLSITAGGYVAAIIFCALWLNARDAIIEEREGCNAAVLQEQIDAKDIVHAAQVRNLESELQDLASQAEILRESLAIAQDTAKEAQAGTVERDETITRLMLEAFEDENDIPDSGECLNAFVLESTLDRVLHPEGCAEAIPGSGPRADQVCAGSGGTDRADPAFGDFSNITYSDALRLWGRDRDTIQILNGRLRAISVLGNKETNNDGSK